MALVVLVFEGNDTRTGTDVINDWFLSQYPTAKNTGKFDEAGRPIFLVPKKAAPVVTMPSVHPQPLFTESANVAADLKVQMDAHNHAHGNTANVSQGKPAIGHVVAPGTVIKANLPHANASTTDMKHNDLK